jgi:hypothetical protein
MVRIDGRLGPCAIFPLLLIRRLGVGVGEAVCGPVGTSWIGDLFPAERRARVLSFVHAWRAGRRRAEFSLLRPDRAGMGLAHRPGKRRGSGASAGAVAATGSGAGDCHACPFDPLGACALPGVARHETGSCIAGLSAGV